MSEQPILELRNISKSFGAVKALQGVSFQLRKGEIHALAGENGAGKSTMMNIIDGILQPSEGEIVLRGEPVTIDGPADAQKRGIGLVHQEIALCPDVSVAENIFMAATNARRSLFMNYADLKKKAADILARLSPVDPNVNVEHISISNQQIVEIAKALTLDCDILILDEPTAALTETESVALFKIMQKLKENGISIIYISHRMAEIFEQCDRVTVLRDGQFICTDNVADITPDDLISKLVGRDLGDLYPPKAEKIDSTATPLLRVMDLTDPDRFRNISFDLRPGEILGVGGLIGSGRSEILQGICGLFHHNSGSVELNGESFHINSYQESIQKGIVYLSEDRKGEGVFLDLSIAQNVSALNVDQVSTSVGILDRKAELEQAKTLGERLNLKHGGLDLPVSSLSGGNQQKVAIAKMLSVSPKIILMDEPTRGIDVGAKVEIHALLRNLAKEGIGLVVVSSELPELIGLCDRILVICEGELSGEVGPDEMTEERIMELASGLQTKRVAA
ncbi:sugar ABC transporter ATP-binding protein [Pseudovibrio sp. Tun.PSC04-5.I4]|uniref:sugar ABC transporter ATP-binding protein n=1 Tax=Pseudovibrio sp. Tun.PSC04-5.I4 TaxID=1798213 RepID=UPI00087F040D|nr:sugar ABC transporter ATP-binding protein [Pseudovibrio sp. Tun.PSC04-5.I4]SDR25233.1 monosaccharide ABC transporter ATP-binding protein, CUT2 family [Pseudovibrio sp. Tun.PSC04-5.I4]